MKLLRAARENLHFSDTLNASRLIGVFGFSQLVQLFSSIARVPAVASTSSLEVLGQTFLWLSLQAWASMLTAGEVNVSRVAALNKAALKKRGLSTRILVLGSISFAIVISIFTMVYNVVWSAGLGPTVIGFIITLTFARNLGVAQGLEKINGQFLSSAFGSVIGLVATVGLTNAWFWKLENESTQICTLAFVSLLTYSAPYFYSKVITLGYPQELQKTSKNFSRQIFFKLVELAAVLPAAFVSGFDALALSLAGRASSLPEYGLVTRLGLVTTIVVSALYVRINNLAFLQEDESRGAFFRTGVKLLMLSAPFIGFFMMSAGPLTFFLSDNKVQASEQAVIAVTMVAVVTPFWIGASAQISKIPLLRRQLGITVLALVLPISVALSFLAAYNMGASGPIYASSVTYLLTFISAWILLNRYQARSNSMIKRES